jgi:hypothetical protein
MTLGPLSGQDDGGVPAGYPADGPPSARHLHGSNSRGDHARVPGHEVGRACQQANAGCRGGRVAHLGEDIGRLVVVLAKLLDVVAEVLIEAPHVGSGERGTKADRREFNLRVAPHLLVPTPCVVRPVAGLRVRIEP